MCGRYITPEQAAAEREFTLRRSHWQFAAIYNVAPSLRVPVVRATGNRKA
jgi:putative SOS response-associated peptidase YedK